MMMVRVVSGIVLSLLFVGTCFSNSYLDKLLDDVTANTLLDNHTKEFDKAQVIKVTEGVYVAIGYALSNSIMLEGPDGLVIIDTTESLTVAQTIREEFRNISNKPVKAIIYTHNHGDHINGAQAFVDDPANPPEVWCHSTTIDQVKRYLTSRRIISTRGMRQFGVYNTALLNAGIGPFLKHDKDAVSGMVYPNRVLQTEQEEITVAGLNLTLIHIPGETSDQIAVWYADKRVLMPADDIYRAFPNLYAIRGTPARDVRIWSRSLGKMSKLRAQYLVPSHTRPVTGETIISDLLTDYKDAIQLVHDQTVRHMNKGLLPDEIAPLVKLPQRLQSHPFLIEFYGTVEWSVRSVFSSYLGWFSGDPKDLFPLTPIEKATRMIELAGGFDKMNQKANKAVQQQDWQWALELSSAVHTVDSHDCEAKRIKILALKRLGEKQVSAPGRNYYLTSALETAGLNITSPASASPSVIMSLPMYLLFELMILNLKAEKCEGLNQVVTFNFTDGNEPIVTLHIRNNIVDLSREMPSTVGILVTTSSQVWKSIVAKIQSPIKAITTGQLQVNYPVKLAQLLGLFEV